MIAFKKLILTLGLVLAGFAIPAQAGDVNTASAPTVRVDKVNLWKIQSPVKNQGLRGTCIAHSSIAALEAAYLRAGYTDIDLSEEFAIYGIKMFWLDPKSTRQPFATENKPGFLSGGFGNGYIHYMANGFMVPAEGDMPYKSFYIEEPSKPELLATNWYFQYEVNRFNLNPKRFNPMRLAKADFYGVKSYRDLSGRDTDQLEAALAEGREVVWDFLVPESAERSTNWVIDPKKSNILGGHSVLIVGYDRTDPENPVFLIKNSWKGRERIRASYEFVRRFGIAATMITEVIEPRKWPELAGLGRWYVEIDGRKGVLDLYHVPGMAKTNFERLSVRGDDGKTLTDRRLGTFFLDGDPMKAYRVNGTLHKDGVSVVIDWENANQPYNATGTAVRLKFTGSGKAEMTGTEARAIRVKSEEAFNGKVALNDWPELKDAE